MTDTSEELTQGLPEQGSEGTSLGYDIEEPERNYDKEGITGEIGRYISEEEKYPQFTVMLGEKSGITKLQSSSLQSMLSVASEMMERFGANVELPEGLSLRSINLYIQQGNKRSRIGNLLASQVKAFLNIIPLDMVVARKSAKAKETTGDGVYAFADCY